MNPLKLIELELTAFRGATAVNAARIPFDPNRKLTMVFGENGSGKSSIVDAFSFLCEGKFGSLEDRSGTGNDYITAITSDSASLLVKLTTSNGVCEGTLKGKATIEIDPIENKPSARILRRAQILQLIEQKPVDRYKALGQYIELPGVIKAEASLRDAEKQKRGDYELAVKACEQAESALQDLWKGEGSPGEDAFAWAVAEKIVDVSKLSEDLESAKKIIAVISTVETRRSDYLRAVEKQSADATAAVKSEETLKEAEAQATGQNSALLGLLQKAKAFVEGEPTPDSCPVCEKSVDRKNLATELATRITAMNSLATFAKAAESARGVATQSATLSDAAKLNYANGIKACAKLLDGSEFIKAGPIDATTIETLNNEETSPDQLVADGDPIASELTALKTDLQSKNAEWQ